MSYQFNKDHVKEYYQVNYVQKYYDELFTNMLETSHEEGLISHNEKFPSYVKSRKDISSYYVMTLSIIADKIEEVYYDMTDVYFSNKIHYALNSDLDDLGAVVGCHRPGATSASVMVTFSLNSPATENIPIEANTIVSTNKGIEYYVVEDTYLTVGNKSVDVYCLSLEKGSRFRVAKNTLNKLETNVGDYSFFVNNENDSSGGTDIWNDDEYRGLILQWVKNNTRGSKEAYTRYFATFDGINGYKLVPNWNGISGTLKIVMDPGDDIQLKRAYDEIKRDVCQLDEDIVMFSPEKVYIDVYATCNVDIDVINPYSKSEKEEIEASIEEAIKVFIDGNLEYTGLDIGEDFVPYQLGIFLNDIVPQIKDIAFTNKGFTGVAKPVTITDEQIGTVGTVDVNIE